MYKILKLMYFLSEPVRCFITYMWRGGGAFPEGGDVPPFCVSCGLEGSIDSRQGKHHQHVCNISPPIPAQFCSQGVSPTWFLR